jgi:hypothetical protein
MRTIKAFNKDEKGYYCKPYTEKFYYEEGEIYTMDKSKVKLCSSGFHASANFDISETLTSYTVEDTYYGIVDLKATESDGEKVVGYKIKILEFLPKDFNVLIQYDKTGAWAFFAECSMKDFDYQVGFQKLLETDKTGKWTYNAGLNWKKFDFELGVKKLLEVDEYGERIYRAGFHWKEFNYKLGYERLLELNATKWLRRAKENWKEPYEV